MTDEYLINAKDPVAAVNAGYVDHVVVIPGRALHLRRSADAMRRIGDLIIQARIDDVGASRLADRLEGILRQANSGALDESNVRDLVSGDDHPWMGRANHLAPPLRLRHGGGTTILGTVTCSQSYRGGPSGMVHGGVIAGLFDAMVATCGSVPDPVVTAWLNVTYLAPTPLDEQLEMSAQIDREEGRSGFVPPCCTPVRRSVLVRRHF